MVKGLSGQVSSLPLAWQFFADSNPCGLISKVMSLTIVSMLKYNMRSMTVSMCEIVESVVRYRDIVAKLKIVKIICFLMIAKIDAHEIPAIW